MSTVTAPARLLILRVAWWSAVALMVIQLVIWPGALDRPSTFIGSEDGSSMRLHWIPIALAVWIVIGARIIAAARPAEASRNDVLEPVRGFLSGSGAILLVIALIGGVLVAVAVLARVAGALLT